jgi:hypothetical protein
MTSVKIRLVGYGSIEAAKKIVLMDDKSALTFKLRRKILLGIKHHADAELDMQTTCNSFFQHDYKFVQRFRKIVSLGLTSRRLLKGLVNGFELTANMDINYFQSAPQIFAPDSSVYLSRKVGRSGIQLTEYQAILEYAIRRRHVNQKIILLDCSIKPEDCSDSSFKKCVENASNGGKVDEAKEILNKVPEWHGLRTYFSLVFDTPQTFNCSNVFIPAYAQPVINSSEVTVKYNEGSNSVKISKRARSEKPIFIESKISNAHLLNGRNIVKDGYLFFSDTSENHKSKSTAMWPRINWSLPNSRLIAVPPFDQKKRTLSESNFLPVNTNWAHFLEDVIPQALLLQKNASTQWVGEKVDPIQQEVINALGLPIFEISGPHSHFEFEILNFVIHLNFRNKIISGSNVTDFFSVDLILMKELRERLNLLIPTQNKAKLKIIIPRENSLFRKLSNQKQVIRYYEKRGFKVVYTSKLPLLERLQIFSNCSDLVYVYGAGGVNSYFCLSNSRITELRHPDTANSKEHLGLVATLEAQWTMILGRRANLLKRLLYGSDSWTVPISKLKS